ncbi:PC4 and SFRS1-interacting protein-like [Macrosteles quadrilineatus]|uniref:PC4 and SFRS1-interacting protein-like n=1 Tax=Macrosteles quadrilineatus TaxID=74068 RepID=UPI0023E34AD5|nr:PC4 and SFRS1-interacting protein-like [Macrosteles quadrilineatus]
MAAPKFKPGDKIFAKVRGYPPWPARVEGVADETPNKMKYHIYFYGTGETAVCKQEELFPYVENRAKFGKPMKKKGFNEAIMQMDSELGLSPRPQAPDTPIEGDSETEGSLIIDETPGKKTKSASNTPVTSKQKVLEKKKIDTNDTESPAVKKPRKKSTLSEQDTPTSSLNITPLETSRSGRKIKHKKISEGADEQDIDGEFDTPKGKQQSKQSKGRESLINKDGLEVDGELLKDGTLRAFTPKGEEVRLKLNLNKPSVFKTEKAKLEWEAKVLQDGKTLKAQIESGEILPADVQKEIKEKYQDKLMQVEYKMALDDKKEKLDFLRTEAQLLDIDVRIKSSLSLKQADAESCISHLDELLSVKIHPLMVKKHPELIDTIKKLRKYVGNTSCWNFSDEETEVFASKAALIRSKAENVYNKIKALFMVPPGRSFLDVFAEELKEFHDTTKEMKIDDVFSLTIDPRPTGKQNEDNEKITEGSAA